MIRTVLAGCKNRPSPLPFPPFSAMAVRKMDLVLDMVVEFNWNIQMFHSAIVSRECQASPRWPRCSSKGSPPVLPIATTTGCRGQSPGQTGRSSSSCVLDSLAQVLRGQETLPGSPRWKGGRISSKVYPELSATIEVLIEDQSLHEDNILT